MARAKTGCRRRLGMLALVGLMGCGVPEHMGDVYREFLVPPALTPLPARGVLAAGRTETLTLVTGLIDSALASAATNSDGAAAALASAKAQLAPERLGPDLAAAGTEIAGLTQAIDAAIQILQKPERRDLRQQIDRLRQKVDSLQLLVAPSQADSLPSS